MTCRPKALEENPGLHGLSVEFHVLRQRTGEKLRTLAEVVDLTARAAHEQELFSQGDWEFIQWLAEAHADPEGLWESLVLTGVELLQWLVRWGDQSRLQMAESNETVQFQGRLIELKPHLETVGSELFFTHQVTLPDGQTQPLNAIKFFAGRPSIALVGNTFFLLKSAPPDDLLNSWGATAGAAGKQAEPAIVDKAAQDAIAHRGGLGAVVRGGQGDAAFHAGAGR